ncbi:hypothetical protein [Pseudomonas putida]|uniref:hypothetical protein n=1 Tax=Pseudomonas putida TaxID=303 RepID=UPI002B23FF55|nr:hypothetical protein [Pseudomonas putida]
MSKLLKRIVPTGFPEQRHYGINGVLSVVATDPKVLDLECTILVPVHVLSKPLFSQAVLAHLYRMVRT